MLTLLMLPLFLALGAPVATVLLPGALLTAAALPASDLFAHDTIRNDVLLPEIVDSHDPREASRIASAQFIGRVDLT